MLQVYCNKMASTSEWGGQVELLALTNVLRRPIEVSLRNNFVCTWYFYEKYFNVWIIVVDAGAASRRCPHDCWRAFLRLEADIDLPQTRLRPRRALQLSGGQAVVIITLSFHFRSHCIEFRNTQQIANSNVRRWQNQIQMAAWLQLQVRARGGPGVATGIHRGWATILACIKIFLVEVWNIFYPKFRPR